MLLKKTCEYFFPFPLVRTINETFPPYIYVHNYEFNSFRAHAAIWGDSRSRAHYVENLVNRRKSKQELTLDTLRAYEVGSLATLENIPIIP